MDEREFNTGLNAVEVARRTVIETGTSTPLLTRLPVRA
jgi:hypothetical protein